jgi:thioesterase domain-containing protein
MPEVSRYTVPSYPGHIIVFCSAGRVEEQQARWSSIARSDLTVHENPGDHWNLVWPPHSTKLAGAIDQYLGTKPLRPNAGHKFISRPVAS